VSFGEMSFLLRRVGVPAREASWKGVLRGMELEVLGMARLVMVGVSALWWLSGLPFEGSANVELSRAPGVTFILPGLSRPEDHTHEFGWLEPSFVFAPGHIDACPRKADQDIYDVVLDDGPMVNYRGNFGKKGEGGVATMSEPIILGNLDRSLIDEVIQRHMNQIRYCYQRELTRNNTLAGKITIKLTIAKDGTVASARTKSTSMNDAALESCIEGRFMKMQFPKPKNGGIVIVAYPFLFSPG
jgi:hypothetical protein